MGVVNCYLREYTQYTRQASRLVLQLSITSAIKSFTAKQHYCANTSTSAKSDAREWLVSRTVEYVSKLGKMAFSYTLVENGWCWLV
ncbi:hypothetical protein OK016_24865 [Vibrio chagasii]|nr:hypothetical protein [Vibrio chagasii]